MKISVIVPVYNVEKYLSRCLESLLNQTYQDYEIICINDFSPDNSAALLAQFEAMYPDKIRVLSNERNMGLGRTRERGLSEARGEYVLFVDSDDYVKNDYIDNYASAAYDGDYDIVVAGYIRDADGKLTTHLAKDTVWSSTTYTIVCAKLYKLSFIRDNELGFTAVTCGEDIFFSLAAYYCGARVKVIPYAGYYYYYNRDSITGSMNYKKNMERTLGELFDEFTRRYSMEAISLERRHVIEYAYLANMVNSLVAYNHGCGIELMKDKIGYVANNLEKNFPGALNNPLVGFFKPKGQTLKIRLAVGTVALLVKTHLIQPFLYLVSLV